MQSFNSQNLRIIRRLSALGFDSCLRAMTDTITNDVIDSYKIEGVNLDSDMVRSSVARKLGVELPKHKEPTHYIDGIVEMMLDAIANYSKPLTENRLFAWHCALFPTQKSGISDINVGKSSFRRWQRAYGACNQWHGFVAGWQF